MLFDLFDCILLEYNLKDTFKGFYSAIFAKARANIVSTSIGPFHEIVGWFSFFEFDCFILEGFPLVKQVRLKFYVTTVPGVIFLF